MSSKDKTREKLVGSMRKTKASAGIGADKERSVRAIPAPSKPAGPQQAPVAPEAKKTAVSAPRKAGASPYSGTADGYQSGRRVWPD